MKFIAVTLTLIALSLAGCTYPFRCSGVFVCGSERRPKPEPTKEKKAGTQNEHTEAIKTKPAARSL